MGDHNRAKCWHLCSSDIASVGSFGTCLASVAESIEAGNYYIWKKILKLLIDNHIDKI